MYRKILILLYLSVILFFSPAQTLEDGSKLFNKGTSQYQNGAFSSAYRSLTRSITIFENLGNSGEEWLMNAHLWAGAAAYNLGEYSAAEDHYESSLNIAERRNSITYQSNIITAMANLKYGMGEYSEAGDWYLKSAALLNESGMEREANQSFEYGGYAKVLGERYGEALEIFEEALDYSPSDRPDSEVAWLYAMRGNCHYYLQDLPVALDDYLLAVTLLEPYGQTLELSQYYGWAGKIQFDMNENDEALGLFQKSLSMAESLNSIEDQSRVLAYFGFLFASSGDYESGAQYYEDSLAAALALGRNEFIIAAYESLAWIYEEAENERLLRETNEKLIELYTEENDKEKLAGILNDQGYLYYNGKAYGKAIPLFERSADLYRDLANHEDLSILLLNLAMSYENTGKIDLAGELFRESLALSIETGNTGDAEELAGHLNLLYSENYDYGKLIESLMPLIPVYRRENRLIDLMHLNNNIGTYYYALREYDKAIEFYGAANVISREKKLVEEQAIHLHNIAQSRAALSEFDQAFEIYNEALQIAEQGGGNEILGSLWNSIGELYRAWGWFEQSLNSYGLAESLFEEIGDEASLAAVYNNMGQAIRMSGDPKESIGLYEKALNINREYGDEEAEAINLSNLGEAFRQSGRNEEALSYYTRALQIDNRLRNLRGIQIRKNNIALLHLEDGKFERAREVFFEGLEYWRKVGNRREEATALRNIWTTHFLEGDYKSSVDYLERSVSILEELRLTASGEVRREYLESQIESYRDLASTYYYLEDPLRSLYSLELSRGKYLLEQMDISKGDASFDWESLSSFFTSLDSNSVLMSYTFAGENLIQAISVESESASGQNSVSTTLIEIEEDFLNGFYSRYGNEINRYVGDYENDRFESILKLYRILLARPVQSRKTESAINEIGIYLYSKLIQSFRKELTGKDHLIIVPDGILATIPFESLKSKEGTYLIEKYDITYSQSMVVAGKIGDRNYSDNRKPLLAMGGAVYEESSFISEEVDIDLSGIRLNVSDMIRKGERVRAVYNSMGFEKWANLPGTLREVNMLSHIVGQSKILTGADVSEENVKSLSSEGELASYEVIHFATHGIVIPEIPELSAVVLSQFSEEDSQEDGYLTMSEISRLNIKADFVNLSACETGLGKIYQGEGVVGLTQAFLVAGANALSVSLWQVSDESTMRFMTGVYSLVEERGLSYSQAISEMKRVFLRDNQYDKPFYWAPFVFYGDYEAGL